MKRGWHSARLAALAFVGIGCTQADRRTGAPGGVDGRVGRVVFHPPKSDPGDPVMALSLDPAPIPAELSGPQPVDAYIRRALAENRTVQAAFHNVRSLEHRIPQVTALDDPVASNTIFPIPSVAPQYSLMGYNPYNLTLAQQFPWFGTRRIRGEVADRDVRVAVAELAAAQLDAVTAVRRAYFDLHAAEKSGAILAENRKILEYFHAIARTRLAAGGSQVDVIRAETLISELDRVLAGNRQEAATARAALARQVHASPEADLRTIPELPIAAVPAEIDRLYRLAVTARPELRGRLEAVARDDKAVELARKRFYPNVTLGLTYMDMEKTNAVTPRTASGSPNVGLFVGFNLPIYHKKYEAGVSEAKERALADAKLYEAQRDETDGEIKDFFTQAKVQQDVLSLLRESILPRTKDTLELAKSEYKANNADIATILSAQREVLQVEIQAAQVEAELSKALASLERAVGCRINERTLESEPTGPTPPPVPPIGPGPFRPAPPPGPR
jgi:cobalt-zinc-cadmium efflux system outer membrane protein